MGMSAPFPVTVSGLYGPVPTAGGFVIIAGISIAETAGLVATIVLHAEGSATGDIIGAINLAANGSTPFVEFPHVRCQGQLYVVVTGTVHGAVYLK